MPGGHGSDESRVGQKTGEQKTNVIAQSQRARTNKQDVQISFFFKIFFLFLKNAEGATLD